MALIEALTLMSVDAAAETEQDASLATYAPKVTREMARIDWTMNARDVSRLIRAYDPKPSAYTTLAGADVKLFGARPVANSSAGAPGTVLLTSDTLVVACGDGAVSISDVQPSGKTRMRASDWSRGRGVREGDRFGE
jgi:methionyl-tRNA formyltransferase